MLFAIRNSQFAIRYSLFILIILSLSACDFLDSLTGQGEDNTDQPTRPTVELTLAVAPHIAWMPWHLANEEHVLSQLAHQYGLNVQFMAEPNYQNTIDKFINEEVQAIAISNIDAIAQLVRREIEADVILITNDHNGNEAILLPHHADTSIHSLRGKSFALQQYTTTHYLLDRYLIRNQIPFEEINILDVPEVELSNMLQNEKAYGVVIRNPGLYKLTQAEQAKILFDSRQIPKELFDLIVVRRETLLDYPNFAQVLLATWFSIMERLQGSRKGPTLDALANLAQMTRQEYETQLITAPLNDTATKALAAIRDRRIRKTMRHLRYFIQRHKLTSSEIFTDWISYPGRNPALLHFNGQPLQQFVAPTTLHNQW